MEKEKQGNNNSSIGVHKHVWHLILFSQHNYTRKENHCSARGIFVILVALTTKVC